jgi:phage tail-like protein
VNNLKPVFKYSFQVKIEGIADETPEYFHAVEGLGFIYQTEQYLPGGYNQPFPLSTVYQTNNLVLKRPLLEEKTNITKWCEEALDRRVFKPTAAHIFILGRNGEIRTHWSLEGLYPIGLKMSSLDLDLERGRAGIMETITLVYTRITRIS